MIQTMRTYEIVLCFVTQVGCDQDVVLVGSEVQEDAVIGSQVSKSRREQDDVGSSEDRAKYDGLEGKHDGSESKHTKVGRMDQWKQLANGTN